MKRRQFIKLSTSASALCLLPLEVQAAMKPFANLEECDFTNRKLILINLSGGNDGLNTIIPLNQYDLYSNLRPTIKVPNTGVNSSILLDSTLPENQQIGLNPALTGFKNLYDQGWLRVLQSVGYPSQNKSHFASDDLYMTGNDGNSWLNGSDSGWIGRFMELQYEAELQNSYPLAIQIGSQKTSLGFHGEIEHGMVLNITGQDPAGFYSVLNGLGGVPPTNIPNSDYGTELDYIIQTDALANGYSETVTNAFNLGSNSVEYPDSDLANQLKTVARLISGGIQSKIFMVKIHGFDTHNAQIATSGGVTGTHYNLLNILSSAVEAFNNDLNAQNIADDVISLTYSEFGRKAKQNGANGTDHGEIAPMFVIGKPIQGGVSGINPDLSEANEDNNFQIKTVQHDYRGSIGTLLQNFLGASDNIVDNAFFNHTLDDSFTNQKVDNLIKPAFEVPIECYTDGLGLQDVIAVGKETNFMVYPNPFQEILTISGIKEPKNISINIYSSTGKLVFSEINKPYNEEIKLNLSSLNKGIYIANISSDGKIETHKVIKK